MALSAAFARASQALAFSQEEEAAAYQALNL
jgi:hypothetical protein